MNRRSTLIGILAATPPAVLPHAASASTLPKLTVYRNPGCGCCEGWVQHPAPDISKFLNERPAGAIGLIVPGMPAGSPGMRPEGSGGPYGVLLLAADAAPTVYAKH